MKLLKDIITAEKERRKAYKSYKKGEISKEEFKKIAEKSNEKGSILVVLIMGILLIGWFFSILLEDKNCYGSFEEDIKVLKEINEDLIYMHTKYKGIELGEYRYDYIKTSTCLRSHILKEHLDKLTDEERDSYPSYDEYTIKNSSYYKYSIAKNIEGLEFIVNQTGIFKSQYEIEKDKEIILKGENSKELVKNLKKY